MALREIGEESVKSLPGRKKKQTDGVEGEVHCGPPHVFKNKEKSSLLSFFSSCPLLTTSRPLNKEKSSFFFRFFPSGPLLSSFSFKPSMFMTLCHYTYYNMAAYIVYQFYISLLKLARYSPALNCHVFTPKKGIIEQ